MTAENVTERKRRVGSLEVVTGCMFSGKTEEFVRRLRLAAIAKQRIEAFKPSIDIRYDGIHTINSHAGPEIKWEKVTPIPPENPSEILRFVKTETSVVGIDEAQFFHERIVEICKYLVEERKIRLIVAGLDMDFRGEPFGPMPTLLSLAEHIDKLPAICTVCGDDAAYTQRVIVEPNGTRRPAHYEDPRSGWRN